MQKPAQYFPGLLTSIQSEVSTFDNEIKRSQENQEKAIRLFLYNNAYFKKGDHVVLTTPHETKEVTVELVVFTGDDIEYTFFNSESSGALYHTELATDDYSWEIL